MDVNGFDLEAGHRLDGGGNSGLDFASDFWDRVAIADKDVDIDEGAVLIDGEADAFGA